MRGRRKREISSSDQLGGSVTRGCLSPGAEKEEEEDPAGAFELPVEFLASPVVEGPSLIAFSTQPEDHLDPFPLLSRLPDPATKGGLRQEEER